MGCPNRAAHSYLCVFMEFAFVTHLIYVPKLIAMNTVPGIEGDYLDILFANRNKSYGGYQLRRHYGARVERAVGFVFGGIAILLLLFAIRKPEEVQSAITPICKIPINLSRPEFESKPPLPEAPKPLPPKVSNPKTKLFTQPVITNEPIDESKVMSTIKELHTEVIGIGSDGDTAVASGPVDNTGGGSAGSEPVIEEPVGPRTYVEQMPLFDGSIIAYLSNNVHYPESARKAGIEGPVLVRFIVNEDGAVSDVEVIRGIGGGCDEEAARAIAAMPHWKPGMQNGIPVKVYFTLPVKFVLQ